MYAHPTIKDVARVAGVHFTTVSMALRGHPSIPAATRERIIAAANRIGYQRNRVFSALSSQRRNRQEEQFRPRLAYIANRSPASGLIMRPHHRMLIEGARHRAGELGYELDVLSVEKGYYNSATLHAYLQENGITGLIIGAFEPDRDSVELPWSDYSVVKVDSRHMDPASSLVSIDQMNGVLDAFARLRALGYRRIGLAVGEKDEEMTDGLHHAGLLLAQSEVPVAERFPPLLFPAGTLMAGAVPLIRAYIAEHRLDALMCNWTNIRDMVVQAGYACPRQVACACLCLPRPSPALAGIVSNLNLVGERAVTLLAAQLRVEQRGIPAVSSRTYVRGNWCDGDSATPKAKSKRKS